MGRARSHGRQLDPDLCLTIATLVAGETDLLTSTLRKEIQGRA